MHRTAWPALAPHRSLLALGARASLAGRRPAAADAGRPERLPLRGHRHRPRASTASTPRSAAATPSSRSRVDDGHTGDRRGLRRASPTCGSARTAPSSATGCRTGHLPERRPQGAGVTIPAEARRPRRPSPSGRTVADGGTYAWHDHRVHWMDDASPAASTAASGSAGAYDPWRVPIVVDGTPAEVAGHPHLRGRRRRPLPWVGAGAGRRGGLLAWFGRRPGVRLAAAALLAVVSLARSWSGRADFASTPGRRQPAALGAAASSRWSRPSAPWSAGRRSAGVVGWPSRRWPRLSGWALLRHPGPHQAGAAHRPPVRGSTAPRPRPRLGRQRRRRLPRRHQRRPHASPTSTTTSPRLSRLEPADLLEAAVEEEADDGHDAERRRGSRTASRARACARSSCRRSRRPPWGSRRWPARRRSCACRRSGGR